MAPHNRLPAAFPTGPHALPEGVTQADIAVSLTLARFGRQLRARALEVLEGEDRDDVVRFCFAVTVQVAALLNTTDDHVQVGQVTDGILEAWIDPDAVWKWYGPPQDRLYEDGTSGPGDLDGAY